MKSKIVTFYSWKGGVGRSFALANVGIELSNMGFNVLLIDWDLEAPGLERYFIPLADGQDPLLSIKPAEDPSGLMGLLRYTETNFSPSELEIDWKKRCWQISTLKTLNQKESQVQYKMNGSLSFLPSGIGNKDYTAMLQDFSWRVFFAKRNGYNIIEELRRQWTENYDLVLVDSRTGLTDSGGVCTVQLPNLLVFVYTACGQSVEEGIRFLDGVQKSRESFPNALGQLSIIPLLSRWDGEDEVDLAQQWLSKIEPIISTYVASWLPKGFAIRRLLEELRIPHVSRFSFGEQLPVLTHSITDPKLPGKAFSLVARILSSELPQAASIIDPAFTAKSDPLMLSEEELYPISINADLRKEAIDAVAEAEGDVSATLIRFLYGISSILLEKKHYVIAAEVVEQAIASARLLRETEYSTTTTLALVNSLLLHSDIIKNLSGLASSLDDCQEATGLMLELLNNESNDRDLKLKLLEIYEKQGNTSRELSELSRRGSPEKSEFRARASFVFRSAVDLGIGLIKENSRNRTIMEKYCLSCENLGGLLSEERNEDEALFYYMNALRIREVLFNANPSDPSCQINLGKVFEETGDVLLKLEKADEAKEYYIKAINLLRIGESGLTDVAWLRRLASSLGRIAQINQKAQEFKEALVNYTEATNILHKILNEEPDNLGLRDELSNIREMRELCLREYGRIQQSNGAALSAKVPLEYRAQIQGRCQRQYIKRPQNAPPDWRPDIQHWIDQWVERVDQTSPFSGKASQPQLKIIEAQIDWRLISNSGVDEGIIRPVIGAGGWPLLPGSSLKGLFRRACPPDRLLEWCGSPCGSGDLRPGILRFHGAWPADASWTKHLLDVAHPQQNWQVGFDNGRERHSAFGVVSLYQPKLLIGLSSTDPKLSQSEWDDIIATMKLALRSGIGGRTCVGYGSSGRLRGDVIFQCGLEGQGPAAKLLDRHEEFRPTMFRAAIRGMALRLFGGLTDQSTTLKVVGELFGALSREEGQHVGLLATAYTDQRVTLGHSGRGGWSQPVYATSGLLQWRLTRSSGSAATDQLLAELLAALHGLTMSLGGFGRGWRRPDHRIFYPGYDKTPIGCHWQWRQPEDLPAWIHVQTAAELAQLLARSRALAHRWLEAKKLRSGDAAPWREVIHPRRTRIWTRTAKGPGDAEVVAWFHRSPAEGQRAADQSDSRDLKHTILAGQMNQVGLIWNRLLPVLGPGHPPRALVTQPTANPMARPAPPGGRRPVETGRQQQQACIDAHQGDYLELVVLHPLPNNASETAQQQHTRFTTLMNRGASADFSPLDWS